MSDTNQCESGGGRHTFRRIGFLGGVAVFALLQVLPAPASMSPDAWSTAAVVLLMALWWTTEAVPLAATAMLPLVLFPALGVLSMPQAASPYANDIVFLSMGGFLIAVAMERCGLHRRIALGDCRRRSVSQPRRLVLGFMLAAAFLSMWISNTATTAMMYPIGMAIAVLFRPQDQEGPFELGICLMLGVAYAATIGGVTTLIGTPPNAVLAATASETLGVTIGFVDWMLVGVPIAIVFLPIGWLIVDACPITRLANLARAMRAPYLKAERAEVGADVEGRMRLVRGGLCVGGGRVGDAGAEADRRLQHIPGIQTFAPMGEGLDDRDGRSARFVPVVPTSWRRYEFALDWQTANKIPWGIIVLFGGGLSMARAMSKTGLADVDREFGVSRVLRPGRSGWCWAASRSCSCS